jgi:hypothetical protein
MFHYQALSPNSGLPEDNQPGARENAFLHMEEVEPAESDSSSEYIPGCFLQFRFEAAHPAKTSEHCFSNSAAKAEGGEAFCIWKMVKASPVFMATREMFQKVLEGYQTELCK